MGRARGNRVKGIRAVLFVAVLANLGVLVVTQHVRSTRLRYEAARRQTELRELEREHRRLLLQRQEERRPERLERRARELGVDVRRATGDRE